MGLNSIIFFFLSILLTLLPPITHFFRCFSPFSCQASIRPVQNPGNSTTMPFVLPVFLHSKASKMALQRSAARLLIPSLEMVTPLASLPQQMHIEHSSFLYTVNSCQRAIAREGRFHLRGKLKYSLQLSYRKHTFFFHCISYLFTYRQPNSIVV